MSGTRSADRSELTRLVHMARIAANGDASAIPLTIAWFESSHHGIGDPEARTWDEFASVFWWRREGIKDGSGFIPVRFQLNRVYFENRSFSSSGSSASFTQSRSATA